MHNLFEYNEDSPSCLINKVTRSSRSLKGAQAGSMYNHGYYCLCVKGKRQYVHRIVWVLHNGEIPKGFVIDHIDGNRANNKITNLRLATISENGMNIRAHKDNTSGIKGICFNKKRNKWLGRIMINGKQFTKENKDIEVVKAWLDEKRKELHGDFAKY